MTFKRREIGRGAAFIYLETIASLISGYLFWIVMSKIASLETVGSASAVISLAGIIAVAAGLGIPSGIQRFLARNILENEIFKTRLYVECALFLSVGAIISSAAVILLFHQQIETALDLTSRLVVIAVILICSTVISNLFRGIVIAAIKTKILLIAMLSTSILKIIISTVLVMMGFGLTGLMIGFTSYTLFSSIILGVYIVQHILKGSRTDHIKQHISDLGHASNKILKASIPFWVPYLVTTLGTQLGIVVVFGSEGASQAGIFFISQTIVIGITSVMYSLFTIILPTLNAMDDGRKRLAWDAIRLSLLVAQPFVTALLFYSFEILSLLGEQYSQGSALLQILLFSMLPTLIQFGVTALVFSYGQHRNVLILGLSVSLPRTIMYFLLVPAYGGLGASVAFTVGAIGGLIASYWIARGIGFKFDWKTMIIIFIVPMAIGLLVHSFVNNYVVGILTIIAVSYPILLKLNILTIRDIRDSIDVLPASLSSPMNRIFSSISRKSNSKKIK